MRMCNSSFQQLCCFLLKSLSQEQTSWVNVGRTKLHKKHWGFTSKDRSFRHPENRWTIPGLLNRHFIWYQSSSRSSLRKKQIFRMVLYMLKKLRQETCTSLSRQAFKKQTPVLSHTVTVWVDLEQCNSMQGSIACPPKITGTWKHGARNQLVCRDRVEGLITRTTLELYTMFFCIL